MRQGYYGNDGATAAAFRAGGGWFDTGDLGWIAPDGVAGSRMAGTVVLTGRSKGHHRAEQVPRSSCVASAAVHSLGVAAAVQTAACRRCPSSA